MKVTPTELPEVLVVEPDVFGDHRGSFMESYNAARYRDAGIDADFVQDNLSYSKRGVLRGLHYQQPNPQGKLVQVLLGEVFDVAVDIRVGSPQFGRWVARTLSASRPQQLYIPPGFAHGFLVLSDEAVFHYKCTTLYDAPSDRSLRWDDPAIGISWPTTAFLLSKKDQNAPRVDELAQAELPTYITKRA